MLKRLRFLLLIIPLLATSCCKKRVYCDPGALKIAFTGFSRGEVRSVILKRYKIGETIKAIDSAQFNYSVNVPVVPNKKDTLWFADYSTVGLLRDITAGNDWVISVLNTGQTITFTNIGNDEHNYQIEKCNGKETACVNEINHFTSNNNWNTGNVLYIQK